MVASILLQMALGGAAITQQVLVVQTTAGT